MPDLMPARVAVYIDFDNVVISRYDQVHGTGRRSGAQPWRADNARDHAADATSDNPIAVKLAAATIDVGALLDYASSFGTVAQARAYADWSVPANAAYRRQLVDRAVDLTQLFQVSGTKNGADIRLAVDAVEDLLHYTDLTHVVVIGGDSDYVALAQRCKQLGRFVVGVGVTGSTSRALIAACDEFSHYDDLPGVAAIVKASVPTRAPEPQADTEPSTAEQQPVAKKTAAKKATKKAASAKKAAEPDAESLRQQEATNLLVRALRNAKADDEWIFSGGLKSQMQRMDSSFNEKSLGFSSFRSFLESYADLVETKKVSSSQTQVRLRPTS